MRFTIVSPDGAEYAVDDLATYRDKYKPLGYRIAREQPTYDDWGVPDGATPGELTPVPTDDDDEPAKSPKRRSRRRKASSTNEPPVVVSTETVPDAT